MKRKITSLLLIASFLLSFFSIYSFANDSDETNSESYSYAKKYVCYTNSYGDKSDDLGAHPTLLNAVSSYTEVRNEPNGNKYGYFSFDDSNKNVYFQLAPSQSYTIGHDSLGYMIFEMDFNDLGNNVNTNKFFEIHSGTGSFKPNGGRVAASDVINIGNDGGANYVYFNGNKANRISIPSNEWVHIRLELSILSPDAEEYSLRCYVGDDYFDGKFSLGDPGVITYFRIGSTNTVGQAFGLDNIALYSGDKNYDSYLDMGVIAGALSMKVGAENASINGKQIELNYAPILINGQVYCPVDILEEYTGKECPSQFVTSIDSIAYIHIDSIKTAFGVSAKSYDMGLILIGDESQFLDDDSSYYDIAEVLKTFVFNIPSPDKIISDVESYTNGFNHPYLLADADKFAELKSIYDAGVNNSLTNSEDIKLYSYIEKFVSQGKNDLNNYCGISPTATYTGIKSDKIPVNPNYSKYSNNGYDNGGRSSIPTSPLMTFAFAYQMTGQMNYARAAYDYMLALGDWNHWGPAHFLNCADAAAPFAIAYDWLYDAFTELNSNGEKSKYDGELYDKSKLATILFTHVIIPGYVQSNNLNCPWPGSVESRYATKTSNWNAVCVSGVVAAALVLLDEDVSTEGMVFETQKKLSSTKFISTETPIKSIGNAAIHVGLDTYADYASKLTSMNLGSLAKYGLDQYMPDGSYVESPGYWAYGTNTFFRLIASLLSATGDDYGFMDAWGIDTTCYFAIHSESSDYKTWSFNDGGSSSQDTSFFFFVGDYYEDDNLLRVRKKQLNDGKSVSLYDVLYYDTTVTGAPELDTEYYMVGVDAFSVRSSWDKGAIYSGIIGGPNKVSHGHMDAGSFIYHNKGKIWFHDIGADNYNMGIGYFSNYKLYRIGAEGHNLIAITSEQDTLPYGQSVSASPRISKSYTSESGGYAVLDMSDSYDDHVIKAERGILFTNSRSTVVIQDEYVFNGEKTAYWFGHYNIGNGYVDDVVISADGRTAFMISGDDMIRVSIVSDNDSLKFEIMDCYTYLLDITHKTNRNEMDGASTETNRDNFRKLAIKCENVSSLKLAVVIEEVDGYDIGTSHEWTDIKDWSVSEVENDEIENNFEADFNLSSDIIGSVSLGSGIGDKFVPINHLSESGYIKLDSNVGFEAAKNGWVNFNFIKNKAISLCERSIITIDFDTFTEGAFFNNAQFGVNVRDSLGNIKFIPLLSLLDKTISTNSSNINIDKSWKHISLIINAEDNSVSVYADNLFVDRIWSAIDNTVERIESFSLLLPAYSVNYNSSVLIDNVRIRSFSNKYDTSKITSIINSKASLKEWEDRIRYEIISLPLALSEGAYIYNNSDLEYALASGKNATLLRDVSGVINVNGKVKVDTRGVVFNYVSDNYVASKTGNIISFDKGTITVRWHLGTEVITEEYAASSIANFKGQSELIGVISYTLTEYADGGFGYKFYTTGWASSQGGKSLSENEMIVNEDNSDFWLVNNAPIDCKFVTINSSGLVSPYDSESALRSFMSTNNPGLKIVLCDDIEITNKTGLPLATSGKTVYLNGFTLSHKQNDVHMFTYSGSSTGDFTFIGPGTIESCGSRTMITSSSSSNDKTSNYGIVAKHVDIRTDTQLGDIRVGQHRFIDCNIYQNANKGRALVDLWNKNSSFYNGSPVNLLTISFERCNIVCKNTSGYPIISFTTSTYAECYVKDSLIYTEGNLLRGDNTESKFIVSGHSSINVQSLYKDTSLSYNNLIFEDGVMTNQFIKDDYISSGCSLVTNYSNTLPYVVSDDFAKVIWKDLNGGILHTEYAEVGANPSVLNKAVADYLSSLGGNIKYDVREIKDNSDVILTPSLTSEGNLFYSMHIYDNLTMYIYLRGSWYDNDVKSLIINDITIMKSSLEEIYVDGVRYYRYSLRDITPSNAAKVFGIEVTDIYGKTLTVKTSVLKYIESLLLISNDNDEKILLVKLLRYIDSAYIYFKGEDSTESYEIKKIISRFAEYDLIFEGLKEVTSLTGTINNVVRSARINLSASVRFRFDLNPTYTGSLTIKFNGEEKTYAISDGKCNGRNYIEVNMPAATITDSIILISDTNTVEYGLNAYATDLNNVDKELYDLLFAATQYSAAARRYLG